MIRILRTYKLSKKEINSLLKEIDTVEEVMKKIDDNPLLSSIIGEFLDGFNFGKETDVVKLVYVNLQRLMDNDLHALGRKIELGNESIETGYEDYIINTENRLQTRLRNIADNDKAIIEKLNAVISEYGIAVDPDTGYFLLKTPIKYNSGINSIVWLLDDEKVLMLTTERIKYMWNEINPYIKVYSENIVTDGVNTIFVQVLNRLTFPREIKNDHVLKLIDDVMFWLDRGYHYYDNDVIKVANYVIKNLKGDVYKSVIEQMELMKSLYIKYINQYPDRRVNLDIHYGNIAIDKDNNIVLTDVLYGGYIGEKNEN
jgi:hypothetical protein